MLGSRVEPAEAQVKVSVCKLVARGETGTWRAF